MYYKRMNDDEDNSAKTKLKDYLQNSSAHALPRVAASNSTFSSLSWSSLFFVCLCAFSFQAYLTIEKFNRNEKIVNVLLRFESLPFPAVTLCNLNPYKYSVAKNVQSVQRTLSAFESAMDTVRSPRKSVIRPVRRIKRSSQNPENTSFSLVPQQTTFRVISATCFCTKNITECQPGGLWSLFSLSATRRRCLCVENRLTNVTSNCYPHADWFHTLCAACESYAGMCESPAGFHAAGQLPCVCNRASNVCIARQVDAERRRSKRSIKQELSKRKKLYFTYNQCECLGGEDNCTPIVVPKGSETPSNVNDNFCLCFYDVKIVFTKVTRVFDHCFAVDQWYGRGCSECEDSLICNPESTRERGEKGTTPCLCNDKIEMCIQEQAGVTPPWPSTTVSTPRTTTEAMNETQEQEMFEEAQGLKNMTDTVAISTRAKENLVFAASSLDQKTKIAMSYKATELLKKCSYSGHQCDIEDDFQLYVDPTYGNCYTFNSNSSSIAGSSRAGPFYGLRVQVFLNTSDYLPTTEAAGVRLATHPQGEQPFPDTAGYSAPTGFISSFGIYLKRVDRLPAPYGDCVKNGKTSTYIYRESAYTVEVYKNVNLIKKGCHRSCLQELVVRNCRCSDPRFPTYPGSSSCSSNDPSKRQCIADTLASFGGLYGEGRHGCNCREPCRQMVFSVTYSASQWPASAGQVDCPDGMDDKECVEYFKNQGAMIEVYYEELNYQHLEETEAYGWSNLLADFGGQLGLWLGVSVITVIEFLVFIGKIFTMGCIKFRRTVRELRGWHY